MQILKRDVGLQVFDFERRQRGNWTRVDCFSIGLFQRSALGLARKVNSRGIQGHGPRTHIVEVSKKIVSLCLFVLALGPFMPPAAWIDAEVICRAFFAGAASAVFVVSSSTVCVVLVDVELEERWTLAKRCLCQSFLLPSSIQPDQIQTM